MEYKQYKDRKLQGKTQALIDQINAISDEYQRQDYKLTVRQIYYQLVIKNIIENDENEYDKIVNAVKAGRFAGKIDWDMVEDRTREFNIQARWESPAHIIQIAANQYRRDLWEGQKTYCEVWVEKQALITVIQKSAYSRDCPCFACRGYPSVSALWAAANRFIEKAEQGRECIIFYLGDHDPSGQDMTKNLIKQFDTFKAAVTIERIALNMDQIRQYNPPPQPVKKDKVTKKYKDTRAPGYVKEHGKQSWELDALPPEALDGLIKGAIENRLDLKKYNAAIDRMESEREKIKALEGYL